ncbi:IclR family transcriptional regulator [Schumannella luteola]|uniref:DNA-binding IclR family transcriptional regulator n=1 Tax=Schumannella luteola TaxID=472059 RepID=A0A852Y7I2_9MICO|nr:IclR family transcriptional regulator [Schumannella luteola]NYG97842.1 DNA-binding IclR family transcriptional regulator [Schumannella luteola]TPX02900.1 IclR family transcriptional regulator [Schumannella luteola]
MPSNAAGPTGLTVNPKPARLRDAAVREPARERRASEPDPTATPVDDVAADAPAEVVSIRPESDAGGVSAIRKTFAALEFIAERGGASAREVSQALGMPMPTVYRILGSLVDSDYLVHLKSDRRFELGYKLHRLGVSLHRQVGVPAQVKTEIARLHERAQTAAYFAVYRGPDVIVAFVDDCPDHRRLQPLNFGMHEASHATAYGKIMLAGMTDAQRDSYLEVHPLTPFTPTTIVDRAELDARLDEVALAGIAWEHEEFVPGMTCAAIAVRDASGMIVGSAAISAASTDVVGREAELEDALRRTASQLSRWFRTGSAALAH